LGRSTLERVCVCLRFDVNVMEPALVYVRDWEKLSEALERAMATGCSKGETQINICGAISDGKIALRIIVTPSPYRTQVLDASQVQVPIDLVPSDLDWKDSSLERIWYGRELRVDMLLSSKHKKYIELCRPDVSRLATESARDASATDDVKSVRSKPSYERALSVLKELYPCGVPDQKNLPNAQLCRRVGAKLKDANLPDVSDDTILRAAGRRRN
jgi:hypothetical protein